MLKTNYTPVAGLEPCAGVKPCGVQVRVKGGTGPYVPRFIDDGESVILILACKRGDVTVKHIDDLPVLRIDLDANEILEVVDTDAGHELIRTSRFERDRAISEASGYDATIVGPDGKTVHVDADGTALTAQEVAARQGLDVGPSVEEAKEWFYEQEYVDADVFAEVPEAELVDLVGRLPLNEVDYIAVLDDQLAGADPVEDRRVLAAINARLAAHAEAAHAPGLPLEDGLPIVEVRSRLQVMGDVRIVRDLFEAERNGKGRKRVLQALEARLDQLEAAHQAGEGEGSGQLEDDGDAVGAVDEDPFG